MSGERERERAPGHHAAPGASGWRPSRHRPAHRGAPEPPARRLPALALVAALLVAGGLASALTAAPSGETFHPPAAALASLAAPAASDASSWYCTGGTGPANQFPKVQGTLYLVNSGTTTVTGTLTVYDGTGKSASKPISVPALGETTATPGSVLAGDWLASRVDLNGGQVAVTELVAGSAGWAMAPCSSVTAPNWYFASGATTVGNLLFVSLFNPTPSAAVADVSFVTGQGVVQPAPFQGLIVSPGAVVTAQVPAYVQNQASVATLVTARSGRLVASELQVRLASGRSGVSLRLGTPKPAARWYLPQSANPAGGHSRLVVFNPSTKAAHVEVAVRLPSGPVAPLKQVVPPRSAWTLDLTAQTRVPPATDYGVVVTSSGGRGVVVDRVTSAPASAPAPQWGAVTAIAGAGAVSPSGWWSLPNPALDAAQVEPGAQPTSVALLNPGDQTVRATVGPLGADAGSRAAAHAVQIRPHGVVEVPISALHALGTAPVGVKANLPLAVVEGVVPSGVAGTVLASGIPQG